MKVVFDVGGSHMRIGVSENGRDVLQVADLVTPAAVSDGLQLLVETGKKLAGDKKIEVAAGGVAGVWDQGRNKLLGSPNLSGWVDYLIKEKLSSEWGVEVKIENDAAVGALGEGVFGAGAGKRIVAYLAVGTGVGGARIVDGKIDANFLGFEPGHQYIKIQNLKGKGQNQEGSGETLEELVGGRNLERRYGKRAEEIGDPWLWEEVSGYLAVGVVNTILLWSPDIVVLGGSVIKSMGWDFLVQEVSRRLKVYPWVPPIVRGKLESRAGLYGALALLR